MPILVNKRENCETQSFMIAYAEWRRLGDFQLSYLIRRAYEAVDIWQGGGIGSVYGGVLRASLCG